MKLSYPVPVPDASEKLMAWCCPYEDAYPYLRGAGYQGIELLVKNPDTVDKERLNFLLQSNQLELSCVGTGPMQRDDRLYLMGADKDKRKEAVRRLYGLIELASLYHVPVLIGKYRGMAGTQPGCRLEDFERIMTEADETAGSSGIELFLEPQGKDSINNLNTVEECVSWIERNRYRNVKLLMDIFHMEQTEDSITGTLERYRDYIGMVHMSDSRRLVPGYGKIPVKQVLEVLEDTAYGGYISMEIRQYPDSATTASLSAMSINYIETLRKMK